MYSLYVVGGNGTLTAHQLEPQQKAGTNEGDDAPIDLMHSSKLCWKLLRYTIGEGEGGGGGGLVCFCVHQCTIPYTHSFTAHWSHAHSIHCTLVPCPFHSLHTGPMPIPFTVHWSHAHSIHCTLVPCPFHSLHTSPIYPFHSLHTLFVL